MSSNSESAFDALQQADMDRFARRLVALRRIRCWSREKLAVECQMSTQYLAEVEAGKHNIPLLNILRLVRALGCKTEELFSEEE
jgi:transcriptional regulator with XRE-family HTH domain